MENGNGSIFLLVTVTILLQCVGADEPGAAEAHFFTEINFKRDNDGVIHLNELELDAKYRYWALNKFIKNYRCLFKQKEIVNVKGYNPSHDRLLEKIEVFQVDCDGSELYLRRHTTEDTWYLLVEPTQPEAVRQRLSGLRSVVVVNMAKKVERGFIKTISSYIACV